MHQLSNCTERKIIETFDISDFEIECDTGWEDISHIHKTIEYVIWEISTASGKHLKCADTHILFDNDMNEIYAMDLIPDVTSIQTIDGVELVTHVKETDQSENMFDVTVDSDHHRFYSNGILSHNTTFINALCFAFFGTAITNIKKDNLVNRTNNKDMMVSVEFKKNDVKYRIERGRKPAIFKFMVNDVDIDAETDEGQGENKFTQLEVEKVLGMGHTMFKHLVTLNTFTEPFLSLGANAQREIIEQLLGITLLSEKAAVLRELVKTTKDSIKEEEIKLKTIEDANQRIEKSIKDLVLRQRVWATKKSDDIIAYHHALGELEIVNIDQELSAHDARVTWKQHNQKFKSLERDYSAAQRSHDEDDKRLGKYQRELSSLQKHECYACGQQVHDANHETLVESKTSSIQKLTDTISKHRADMDALNVQLEGIGDLILEPTTYYDDVSDAYEHKNSIQQLQNVIDTKTQETDPYQDQIVILKETGICEISWDKMNDLNKLRDHQEFLFKLLTNKDSFIRKKIIEQNLTYLNARLSHYLEKLGLPHQVSFQSDLSVQITELGRDMDFDNLSRGERNRLILGLSWGFRDVFESMNHPINFMAIDELVDSGMDGNGVEAALEVLKEMARERNKTIFLISHREDLLGRVSNTLKVVKENGFTSFQLEENG